MSLCKRVIQAGAVLAVLSSLGGGWLPSTARAAEPAPPSDSASPAETSAPDQPAPDPSAPDQKQRDDAEYYRLFKLFADTLDQVERNYVLPVDRRELVESAIRGMLSELDPYSSYIPPTQLEQFKTGINNEFGGVGIQVTVEGGKLRVISPLVGTPAYRAGILAGDLILEIDGKTTEKITIDEAVQAMKGPPGTEVQVKYQHLGESGPQTVTLLREIIRVETVLGDTRRADDSWNWIIDDQRKIGYVRLSAFGRHTAEELQKVLDQLQKDGAKALILDLRFNPGGLLPVAIEVSDLFLNTGRIVSTEGRNTAPRVWDAKQPGTIADLPLAVLVNRYSASASEIVAACLQDHHRAVVVGERTWGKGSVQNVVDLDDAGGALKLTTADYRRPSGKNIHRYPKATEKDEWGVLPDEGFEVRLTPAETGKLLNQRRQRDIVGKNGEPPPASASETEPEIVDVQLQKALECLAQRLAPRPAGEPTVTADAGQPDARPDH
jgi:carboxyl-terminal processing protease